MSESKYGEEKLQEMSIFRRQIIDVIKKSESFKKAPIYNPEEKGFTMAIDSRWGTGKTTFLKRLEEELNSDSLFHAIYYNAWECDDFNSAIIPIIYKIYELLEVELKSLDQIIENPDLTKFKNISNRLIYQVKEIALNSNLSLPLGIKVQTGDLINLFKNLSNDDCLWREKDIFQEFKEYTNIKNEFLSVLKTLVPPGVKKVIIIDELDRCRPIYAIETLEAVKHFFDIEDMIFVFAIDIEQLSHSISTMYGQNMDSSGYLRRFFDLQVSFPVIDKYRFIGLQLENKEYNSLAVRNGINQISRVFHLSLREIEKFLSYLGIIMETINADEVSTILIYYFLVIIVLKYENFWCKICNRDFSLGTPNAFRQELSSNEFTPAKYFLEDLEPQIVKDFCMQILFHASSTLVSVNDFKNSVINDTRYHKMFNLLRIPLDSHSSVIDCIKNNLSIIPNIQF